MTGNEKKREEIFLKIVNAWEDIEKDLNCVKNKKNMPKRLTDFFGMTETSVKKSIGNLSSTLKRSITRLSVKPLIKKSSTYDSPENNNKSKFGTANRNYTK